MLLIFAEMKLKYTVDEGSDEPIMLVNKHIGMDDEEGEGIMGPQFQSELMYLDTLGKKRIKVYVCSPGGSVMDGMQMYNAILATKTKVDTYNGGVAASIAGVICQAGRTRYMSDYALLMMHNPSGPDDGKASPELQAFKSSLVKMLIRKNPTKTEEDISDLMNNTTWLNSEQALTEGFADVIERSDDMNKPRATPTLTDAKATWKQYCNYFNSLNQKPQLMLKVTNFLKLNNSANEDSIVNAIEAIQNNVIAEKTAKDKAETEKADALKKVTEKETEITNLNTEITKLKNDLKVKTDAEDAAALKSKEDAAGLLIDNAAKIGKIKNDADTITKMKAQAVKDFDGTKALIEAMPINKTGMSIVDKIEESAEKPKYHMGAAMVAINNKATEKK